MMREFGSDLRLPFMPEQSRNAPIDAAVPKHTVEICGRGTRVAAVSGRARGAQGGRGAPLRAERRATSGERWQAPGGGIKGL